MNSFEIDFKALTIEEHETQNISIDLEGISFTAHVVKGRGGMPLPIGCSSIVVPSDVRSPDGYWFAGLFRPPRAITRLDPRMFFACVAGFLPHLVRRRMIVSSISLNCFQLGDEWGYQLYIPNCELEYNVYQGDIIVFRERIAKLLPGERRFRHAMLNVTDLSRLIKHPASWSLDEDLHFITTLVADGSEAEFPDLDLLLNDKNWATHPIILADVGGNSEYWLRQKAKGEISSIRHFEGCQLGSLLAE